MKKIRKIAAVACAIPVYIAFLSMAAIVLANFCWKIIAPVLPPPGYIIVLGAGLSGYEPSLTLKLRLDKAADLARKFPDARIVVSGGQGSNEVVTEAEAMRRYLAGTQKIDNERILIEDKSHNTNENFQYSKEVIAREWGQNQIVYFVSNGFHMARSGMTAKRAGFKFVYGVPAKTVWWRIPYDYGREDAALIYHFFVDIGKKW